MKYTLRHLEIFLAVAKNQSISLAAKELSMSQSAASAALQELESRYNMKLFDRSAKRVRLNRFGTAMRAQAEQLIAHAQSFEAELLQQEEHQHLKVGASLTIGNYLAFEYLAKYSELHPNIKVDIVVGSTPEIVEKVRNFEVDIGLVEAELHHPSLTFSKWLPDNMVAFCSSKHPYATKNRLTDADITNCEWVIREPGSAHRQAFDHAFQGLLSKLNIRAELTHNEAVKNAVKSGLGVGCLSEITIKDDINAGFLKALKLTGRPMHRHFYFVNHKEVEQSSSLKQWVAICRENSS